MSQQNHRYSAAVARTKERYRPLKASDRYYVASKLKFDPIGRVIDEITGELGDVFDVGCGRGQLGLLLYELGKVRTLSGFDWDEHKVGVAQTAATGVGRYAKADIKSAAIPVSDTVLVADVLHYISFDEQDRVLSRAAAALREGGKLIVRDVDARRTVASLVTRACERIGVGLNVNRGRTLSFRSREEQCDAIARVGLTLKDVVTTPGLFLDNVLIIAERPTRGALRH